MKVKKHSQKEIAKLVGTKDSNISKELARNKSSGKYDAKIAHNLAKILQKGKNIKQVKLNLEMKIIINNYRTHLKTNLLLIS